MKTMTAGTESFRHAAVQEVAWLLTLGFPGGALRASTRALPSVSGDWPALILDPPDWGMTTRHEGPPLGLAMTKASLSLADAATDGPALSDRFAARPPAGLAAELALLWRDQAGAWDEAAAVVMLRGRVVRAVRRPGAWRLELVDELNFQGARPAVRLFERGWLDDADPGLDGRPLPVVFGIHERLPLTPLRTGPVARLAAPLRRGEGVMRLSSVEGFPDAGRVQAGEEVIEYAAIDRGAATLGTAAHPLTRPEGAPLHSAGEVIRVIPGGGFLWLAADHPCPSFGPLHADGIGLDDASWSAEEIHLDGVAAQAVRMPLWPVRSRHARTTRRTGLRELLGSNPWTTLEVSTAAFPAHAVDAASTATHAVLSAGASLLAFELGPAAARSGPMAGLWSGASLVVRFGADAAWVGGTRPVVRVLLGGDVLEASLPPAATDGAARAIRELRLDLTPVMDAEAGWGNLAPIPALRVEVDFNPAAGETAALHVHDVEIEVDHFARLGTDEAREITARVEGLGVLGGAANPALALAILAADPRFGGLPVESFDWTSFGAAFGTFDAWGLNCARVLRGGVIADALDQAARESGLVVRSGGAMLGLAQVRAVPWPSEVVEDLDDSKALDPDAVLDVAAPAPPPGGESAVMNAFRRTLRWLVPADDAPARPLRRRIAWTREPAVSVFQTHPLGTALLEPGDTVLARRDPLGLVEAACWVGSVGTSGDATVRIRALGPHAGGFAWREGTAAFIRPLGFGDRLVFFLAGVPVVSFSRDGTLTLAGGLREGVELGVAPPAAPLALVDGALILAVPDGPGFTPFARVTSGGVLELAGTVSESVPQEHPPQGGMIRTGQGLMVFSSDGSTSAAHFDLSEATLSLAGMVREDIEVF